MPAFPADRESPRRRSLAGPDRALDGPATTRRPPRPANRPARASTAGDRPLRLDLAAVSELTGLAEETAFLRAAARRIAAGEATDDEVKRLAELRLQVEALGRTLKTQRALEGGAADALSAALARVLEQLGDEPEVPR
jgi:hypothetical protein